MDFKEGAQFDPGFVQHISAFVPNIEYAYGSLNRFKNFGMKKQQFKMLLPKIEHLLENYLGFYMGCMLWAGYIKNLDDTPVLNNFGYGCEYDEAETLSEVDFILNYIEQLKKDIKYYTGKDFSIDTTSMNILESYRAFLKANEGFSKVGKTSDIVMPDGLKEIGKDEEILAKIEEVIENGNLKELISLSGKLF